MTGQYLATLDDLAMKRRALTDVIVTLANIQGVDPAPYLDRPLAVTDDAVEAVTSRLKAIAKKDPPPRPQRPASPSTNGAGLEDKVLHTLSAGPPMRPKDLSDLTGIQKWKLLPVMERLVTAKKVKKSGHRRGLKYALA